MAGQDELVLAAAEALAKATQAHESLVEAHTACEQKTPAMTELQGRIAADRELLISALEELGQVTGESAARLALAVNTAAVALGEVDETADAVGERSSRLLGAATTDLDDAATRLGELTTAVGQLVTAIQAMHRSTLETVASAQKELASEGEQAESGLRLGPRAAYERAKPVLEELLDDALELLETTLPEALDKMVELWETRREQAVERTGESFAAMLQHADAVTAHCAYQVGAMLGAERETTTTDAGRIAGELHSLSTSLDTRKSELESALQALAERFTSEQAELRVVTSHFDEARGRWATFGFA